MTDTIEKTTQATEIELIEAELRLCSEIGALRQRVAESRKERRASASAGDAEAIRLATEARDEARAKVERLTCAKTDAKARLAYLNNRLDAGDESVSLDDVMAAEKAVERAARLEKPAKAALAKAETKLRPLLADNHLALLAADVLEKVTDIPVIVRKRTEDAPMVEPSIILSQTMPTEDYGTLNPSGTVTVKVVGDPAIDWRAVRLAFGDTGSEASASSTAITFDRAAFPIPVLAAPSQSEVTRWAQTFAHSWCAFVETKPGTERLQAAGYSVSGATGFTGYSNVISTDLVCDGGKATGSVKLSLATTEDLSVEEIKGRVDALLAIFKGEHLGLETEAGEIVAMAIAEASVGARDQWKGIFYRRADQINGHLPQTVDVVIEIEYRYAEPSTVAGD